jgi:hypothetical protein
MLNDKELAELRLALEQCQQRDQANQPSHDSADSGPIALSFLSPARTPNPGFPRDGICVLSSDVGAGH